MPAVPPLTADRLSDRLAAHLAGQIERGELAPGDRLPTEVQLSAAHGVSRTVVREAVHQLRSRGLLLARQGSGVYVQPPAPNRPLDFDSRVLESFEAVAQVVEVRRALEGEIAALAAERATPAQVKALKQSLVALERAAAAGGDGVEEDLAFHRLVAEATGNPQFGVLLRFLEQYLRDATKVTRGNEARRADFAAAVRNEHAEIVAAIAAHDPERARRMAARHMEHATQRLAEGGVISTPKKTTPKARSR